MHLNDDDLSLASKTRETLKISQDASLDSSKNNPGNVHPQTTLDYVARAPTAGDKPEGLFYNPTYAHTRPGTEACSFDVPYHSTMKDEIPSLLLPQRGDKRNERYQRHPRRPHVSASHPSSWCRCPSGEMSSRGKDPHGCIYKWLACVPQKAKGEGGTWRRGGVSFV